MKKTLLSLAVSLAVLLCFPGSLFADDGQASIQFWHNQKYGETKDLWRQAAEEFMAEHPHVKITVSEFDPYEYKTRLREAMKAENPPDIFACSGSNYEMNWYVDQGLLKDLTRYIRATDWGRSFSRSALDSFSRDKKYFGVPLNMSMIGIWYNKAIFRQHGLKPFRTWSDLLAGVKKLKSAGVTPIALSGSDKWPGFFWWSYLALRLGGIQALHDAAEGKVSFQSEPFVQAGELLQELIALQPFPDNYLKNGYIDGQVKPMADGKTAMELTGHWTIDIQKSSARNGKGLGDDLGFMPFPGVSGGKGDPSAVIGGGDGLALGRNAPREALDFLKFVTRDKVYGRMVEKQKTISVVRGGEKYMQDDLLRQVAATIAAAKHLQYYFEIYINPDQGQVFLNAVQGIYTGKSPRQVAADLQKGYERRIPWEEVMGRTKARRPNVKDRNGTGESEKSPIDAEGRTVIEFWHPDTYSVRREVWQSLADQFMKENPDVFIRITALEHEAFKQKLSVVMQAGDPPDIFTHWGGGVLHSYIEAGYVKDITKELSGSAWGRNVSPGACDAYTYKERHYGVPYDMGMVGIWYNKKIFKEHGLKEFRTWQELLAGVRKLKKAGVVPIALGAGDKWPAHFWWTYLALRLGGRKAFERAALYNGSFRDRPFVEAGKRLQELADLGAFQEKFLEARYDEQERLLGNGQAAMELMGQWAPMVQKGNSKNGKGLGDDLGMMSFPMVKGGAGDPADVMGGGNGLALATDAPPEAVRFLEFITRKDIYRQLVESEIAPITTVRGMSKYMKDENLRRIPGIVARAKYYQLYYDQCLPPAVGAAVNDATCGLLAKTLTPEAAADLIERAMEGER